MWRRGTASEASPHIEEQLEQHSREPDERKTGLDQCQSKLERRQLGERETRLEEQTAASRAWEDRLTE